VALLVDKTKQLALKHIQLVGHIGAHAALVYNALHTTFIIIIIIMVTQPVRAVASLHHHVHGQQHASRGLQSESWNRFIAGRATCSMDDQVSNVHIQHYITYKTDKALLYKIGQEHQTKCK